MSLLNSSTIYQWWMLLGSRIDQSVSVELLSLTWTAEYTEVPCQRITFHNPFAPPSNPPPLKSSNL